MKSRIIIPKISMYGVITLWMIMISLPINASSYPIIFLHGQIAKGDVWRSLQEWNRTSSKLPQYTSCMRKILNEGYGGYTEGSPLDCDKNSTLVSTGGNTKKIYNFSYYNPDGSKGAIGLMVFCLEFYLCPIL